MIIFDNILDYSYKKMNANQIIQYAREDNSEFLSSIYWPERTDIDEIFDELNSISEDQKNGTIFFILGKIYYICMPYKFNKIIEFYEKAVSMNNSNAMFSLALMYDEGVFMDRDIDKSIQLLKNAISLNHIFAMSRLAFDYEQGKGVKQDYDEAINLLAKACELSKFEDPIILVYLVNIGIKTEKNCIKVIELFEKWIVSGYAIDTSLKSIIELLKCSTYSVKEYLENSIKNKYNISRKLKETQNELQKAKEYITHLECRPGGPEMLKAQERFEKRNY